MEYWSLQLKDIGLHTELLEAFDWDEEALAVAVQKISVILASLGPGRHDEWMQTFKAKLSADLKLNQIKILEKIINLEIKKLLSILNAPEA